ncbi:NADP-dependent oxidoreductase [Cystobacter fuscus]|uniref:NADP-dependent oxidoreductase n=1 Tax=Cystobacter fuscus TaxID=43 RepID=UPI002B2BFB39|nr:NADP-dependent oxidoreductase [Cystobacter fuscus]
MRAARYDQKSGIEGLCVSEVPEPVAAPGHVVVRVMSTCINPGSLLALSPGAAFKPHRDLAGEVVAVGEGVQGFAVGDAVLGWSDDTAHAQLAAVPVAQLVFKPAQLSWDVAGSLFVSAMAGLACVKAVEPKAGELVVVSGASGSVGLVAGQLARRSGAKVIGLARPANAVSLEAHGIIPVAYGDGQEGRIRAAAGGAPISAFIDAAGSGSVELALALGVSPSRINTVVDFKAAQEKGVKTMGTRQAGSLPALSELARLAASGELDIPIAATFPLERLQDAYRRVADRSTHGKVVLRPQE